MVEIRHYIRKLMVFLAIVLLVLATLAFFLVTLPSYLNISRTLRQAKEGDSQAQRVVGGMYATGDRAIHSLGQIIPNREKAIYWYEQSASHGNGKACWYLAALYEQDHNHASDNLAVLWYVKGATLGSSESAKRLADIYQKGLLGMPIDTKKANFWRQRQQYDGAREDKW